MQIFLIMMKSIAFIVLLSSFLFAENALDTFGVKKIYKTKEGSVEWNSAHWANGVARGISWDGDPYDPLNWTDNRSDGNADPFFQIDGNGVMQMRSVGPRFHINSLTSWAPKTQFYKNVEFTAYYRKISTSSEPAYGGMVLGVRSGPLGHASSGGNNCDASTYYARFRHDGKWDFEKEWKHPGSYYQSQGILGKQTPLFNGNLLPVNEWIGMKFIVYNETETSVKMELYIDTLSHGDVSGGGVWEFVDSATDDGTSWSGASYGASAIEGCETYNGLINAYDAILEGHGIALMRTDGIENNVVQAEYKNVSVREIDFTKPFLPEEETGISKKINFKEKRKQKNIDMLGRKWKNASHHQVLVR